MDLLYKEHFGLRQGPFNITADPEFLYLSASHREGLAQLSYGIKGRKGFVVLTGEVGTGKTTLIHTLLGELGGDTRTALIFSHIADPLDLLRYICNEFDLKVPKNSRGDLYEHLTLLNAYLLARYRAGENCALIIDEAQNLSAEVLESVRLLSNFETSKDKLLQILLVGQPELSNRLNSQELRQLKQRVTLRHHLRPLTLKECQEYVANRLRIAGGDSALFTPKALELICACSGGIPRIINVVCDNALLTGYTLGKAIVGDSIVRQVAEDLNLTGTTASVLSIRNASIHALNGTSLKRDTQMSTPQQTHFDPPPARPLVNTTGSPGPRNAVIPRKFFDELSVLLLDAMGPMASVVLKDRVASLGESLDRFPKSKISNLIEALSHEILDTSMKQTFQQLAQERISTLSRLEHS
ncbi:MAG: AAA family ATPase [Deltaproteobacteria bacterium]|nr:AAA family ATPase [Deltaproteobacteria bacterium]